MSTGQVLAKSDVWRAVDQQNGFWGSQSHTAALVNKQVVHLVKLPGTGKLQLHVAYRREAGGEVAVDPLQLDGDEWDLLPPNLDLISREVYTMRLPPSGGRAAYGDDEEPEEEDLPLFGFELRRKQKGSFLGRLLRPGTAAPRVGRPANEPDHLRLAFDDLAEAREWYALVALCTGEIGADDPSLRELPLARSQSGALLAAAAGVPLAVPGAAPLSEVPL